MVSILQKGEKHSKESKEAISNSMKENHRDYNWFHTQETKDKIRKSMISYWEKIGKKNP